VKFKSTFALHAQGETIRREPGFWDKFKKVFGATPNLDTDRVQTLLTTAHLLSGVKKALERVGITNAVALVIDGQVLFEDRTGKADDVGDLFLAFYENEAMYGRDFKALSLTVEHREGGLHVVIEVTAKGEHQRDESTALVTLSGRITEFEPRQGEDAEAFRKRVEPHLASPAFTESHRMQYESFVERVREGLMGALADVKLSPVESQTRVQKPEKAGRTPARRGEPQPGEPGYDPYDRYYPSPMHDLATMMFWTSMMSWAWHPTYVVVNGAGTPVGTTDEAMADGGEGLDEGGDEGDSGDSGEVDAGDDGGFDWGDGEEW
jgi:hypothetical protein